MGNLVWRTRGKKRDLEATRLSMPIGARLFHCFPALRIEPW
jgi:hypothetical protein